ncbi:SAM-dependent methyltransferase [Roseomonas sp. BN140053]|uniref:SAM-dependent methyltransferase n=1 Tax=Roseomonas sp. BN140053 TaxID=3391898 RepID=UPI0039ED56A5
MKLNPLRLRRALRWTRRLAGAGVDPEATAWAMRLFIGREPHNDAEVAFHSQHGDLHSLRVAFSRTHEFRAFLDAYGHDKRKEYAAPLWLLRPPADPELRWRFEPPSLAQPTCQLCTAEQFAEPAYAAWCVALGVEPVQHRKQWEFCWLLAAMQAAGVLRPGHRALGFGTGKESIPSVLAARGLHVVASDAPMELIEGQGWTTTNQHSHDVMDLHFPNLLDEAVFRERVSFRPVDMNAIPTDLRGFDLCWSSCSFEHLGSIEHGLRFVENSLETLRPGGLAVHTTEFNLSSNDDTVETPTVSLFRRRDFEALLSRLRAAGHEVWPLNLHPGYAEVDAHIDVPPYGLPHLKLALAEYVTTSIGIMVRRGG